MKRYLLALALLAAGSAHAAKVTVPFTVAPGSTGGGGGGPSLCPDDDGSAGATAGVANYPTLISAGNYKASPLGAHGNGCKTPGVDYYVGVPQGLALKDPTTAAPAGCKYDGSRYLDCTGAVTVSGYDFSLHSTLLTGSGTTTVTNSKFVFAANCTDPVINVTGSLTFTHTTIDGTAGWTCNLNQGFGSFVNVNPPGGGFFFAEYNHMPRIAQDGFDMNAPGSGNVAITIKYNAVHREGSTGHPDWLQFCGGGGGVMTPVDIRHNLWYGQPEPGPDEGGTQPLHVEAQNCGGAGHITNATVANNVVLGTGTCQGGNNWPIGCAMNFGIACKLDDSASSNVNFRAYGNHVDASGGITALTNGYGCKGTTWGSPQPNYDMTAGTVLGNNPAMIAAQSRFPAMRPLDLAHRAKIKAQMARLVVLETERQARLK